MSERDEQRPRDPPQVGQRTGGRAPVGFLVRGLGSVFTIAGLITWFSGYAGVDDWRQITIGIVITGFGITWEILGRILSALEDRW